MITAVFNDIYLACCDVSQKIVDVGTPVVNKTIELSKQIFAAIGQFIAGLDIGTVVIFAYIIFQPYLIGYSLDLRVAFTALFIGIIVGIGIAIDYYSPYAGIAFFP